MLTELKQRSNDAATLLKALANTRRLQILCHLYEAELSVGQLVNIIGLSQSALSQHLAKLREDGLVSYRKQAQTVYYTLNNNKAQRLLTALQELYSEAQ